MSQKDVEEKLGFTLELKDSKTIGVFPYFDEQNKILPKAGSVDVGVKTVSGSPWSEKVLKKRSGSPEARETFDGVDFYLFHFYKGKMFKMHFSYEDKQFKTIQAFTSSLSASLKLPSPSWKYIKGDNTWAWMDCSELTITARIDRLSIDIVDSEVREHVKSLAADKLKTAFDEERRKEETKRFKP